MLRFWTTFFTDCTLQEEYLEKIYDIVDILLKTSLVNYDLLIMMIFENNGLQATYWFLETKRIAI
jgi:hypothetical protein